MRWQHAIQLYFKQLNLGALLVSIKSAHVTATLGLLRSK
jgi:hypothetical protein